MTERLPIFPLGTVLVPTAVLPLHIFEPRYRTLMDELTTGDGKVAGEGAAAGEFGVVLISRGSEVGGGDVRVAVGTVARILEAAQLDDGRWVVAVAGTRRFRVQRWLDDDPYPVAEVADIGESDAWGDAAVSALDEGERRVRRALALAAELGEGGAPVTFELSSDPLVAAWQLVALAPVGPLDRQQLLEVDDALERMTVLGQLAGEIGEVLAMRLGQGQ